MNSLKILKIKKIAKVCFKKNLINLGFGGSCLNQKKPNDWDIVLILNDFKVEQIQEFVKICKTFDLNISPCVVTKIQSIEKWPSKALVMLYKGIEWVNKNTQKISKETLKKIIKKNSLADMYAIEKKVINGDLSLSKAFSLLRQIVLLCQ